MSKLFKIKNGVIVNDGDLYVSGSKVSIGTATNPEGNFHIYSPSSNVFTYLERGDGTYYGEAAFETKVFNFTDQNSTLVLGQSGTKNLSAPFTSFTSSLEIIGGTGTVVVNEGGISTLDFRVESNTNTHMLFVDSSANKVGIGTSSPGRTLHVSSGVNDVGIKLESTDGTIGIEFKDNTDTGALYYVGTTDKFRTNSTLEFYGTNPKINHAGSGDFTVGGSGGDLVLDGSNLIKFNESIELTNTGDSFRSSTFASGWTGQGFSLDYSDKSSFEIDDLTVRGTLSIYELLINQIRATNGSLFVSSVGKVDGVVRLDETDGEGRVQFALTFDTGSGEVAHGFMPGDIIRAQRVNWNALQGASDANREEPIRLIDEYLVYRSDMIVTEVTSLTQITASLSESSQAPTASYEYVRLGNDGTSANRQGNIYLTSDDNFAPFIDVVDGITSHADWNNASSEGGVKVRMGKLDGISTTTFGPLEGYGLWASGSAYLEGGINATTGSIAGISLDSGQIYTGNGNFDNSDTGFYLNSQGSMSLKDTFSWDGTNLTVTGSTVTIGVEDFTAIGQNVEISGSNFHLLNGNITASNVDLSGKISATSGKIGGFEITSTSITSSNDELILNSNGQITGSKVLFTGGKISGSSLTLDVTNLKAIGDSVEISGSNFHLLNGNITASNVDLTGKITANSGTIGGWSVLTDTLNNGNVYLSNATDEKGLYVTGSGNVNMLQVGEFEDYIPSPSSLTINSREDVTTTNSKFDGYTNNDGFVLTSQTTNAEDTCSIFIPITGSISRNESVIITQPVEFESYNLSEIGVQEWRSDSIVVEIVSGSDKTVVASSDSITRGLLPNPAIRGLSSTLNTAYLYTGSADLEDGDLQVKVTYTADFNRTSNTGQFSTLVDITGLEVLKDRPAINITPDQALFYAGENNKIEWTPSGVTINTSRIDVSDIVIDGDAYITSSYTNVRLLEGKDKNGDGIILGVAANGDPYLAPISKSEYEFNREIKYSQDNEQWSIESNLDVSGSLHAYNHITASKGILVDWDSTNVPILEARDSNRSGSLFGIKTNGEFYIAPISKSSGEVDFTREIRFDLTNQKWVIEGDLDVTGTTTSTGGTETHITVSPVASDSTNTGNTFIQSLEVDSFGHLNSITTGSVTAVADTFKNIADSGGTTKFSADGVDTLRFAAAGASAVSFDNSTKKVTFTSTDTQYSAGSGISLSSNTFSVAAGSGLTQEAGGLAHADTSAQVSVDNSDGIVIQDVTLDTYGHVTELGSVNLDNRYLKNTTDTLTGDLTVTGKITAEEFHTEFVSSSIIFQSGSTKFGNDINDVHAFTGSILQSQGDAVFANNVSINTTDTSNKLTIGGSISASNINLGGGIINLGDSTIREVGADDYDGGDGTTVTHTVASLPTGSYDGFFFDYVVRKNVSNGPRHGRTGTIMAFYSASVVEYTDVSTQDIGDAADHVILYVEVDDGDLALKADVIYSNWKIKAIARGI